MARIACLKDFHEYALMIGALAREGGHEVYVGNPPLNFEQLVDFNPQAIVIGLFRKRTAFNRPIEDLEQDVLGLETLRQLEDYPALRSIPLVILGNGIEENEVPTTLNYDLFLFFPDDMHLFLPKLDELTTKVKSRRKLSGYICPCCKSRMTYQGVHDQDLFCPRCGTSVAIIDEGVSCIARDPDGRPLACSIDAITSPKLREQQRARREPEA